MTRIATLCLPLGLALAVCAEASDHYAIIRNSDREVHPVVTAEMSSLDYTPMNVTVLHPSGGGFATLDLGDDFFASIDLVALGNGLEPGQAKLVSIRSVVPVYTSVVLRGDQGEVFVPPTERTMGTRFAFPIGDLGKGVTLLIGSPNQGDIEVDVFVGSISVRRTVPGQGVLAIPLTGANHRYEVITVGPTGGQPLVIAALVYSDKGRSSRMVMLIPAF